MAKRATQTADRPGEYGRLENRLVLAAWLNSLFGYAANREMLKDLAGCGEAPDRSGRNPVVARLLSNGEKCQVGEADLNRYDGNIRRHLAAMNKGRAEKITLRYFQYAAALYAEVYLDRFFNRPKRLLTDLNAFVKGRNAKRFAGETADPKFEEGDLQKLAFWMATGSGKTLLMHINYRQFLHYNRKPLDNVLLVTPNEGLTEQHIEQFGLSGIGAERFDGAGGWTGGGERVRVIEITKLVEEKRGGGVSVPVEAFEGNNLIFVDEGHKGSGGEAWRGYREALGRTGFTFEYSATFGQALNAVGNDDLTREYAKAVAFDYSYRYFYGDGFGKEFNVQNLRRTNKAEETDILMLANLLSFFEQVRYFETHSGKLKAYNLAEPLWLFIGQKVSAVYTENGRKRSDVLSVVQFLSRFLRNEGGWAVRSIEKVLAGESGLRMDGGADLFANDLLTLKGGSIDGAALHGEIVRRVFRAEAPAGIEMNSIRGADGEMGLRVHGSGRYFGLIYVGDTAALRDLVQEHAPDVETGEDVICGAVFPTVNRPGSDVRMLIGAKRFIEGWDSWRVSNMCLLNVGRSEGSEIIQLFGRGVRLKGLKGSLKRSTAIVDHEPPKGAKEMRLLERLNIFAVRADYMTTFREYLEREGVETGGVIELDLPLWNQTEYQSEGLYVPQWSKESTFLNEEVAVLDRDEKAAVRHDVSTVVETISGVSGSIHDGGATGGATVVIRDNLLEMLDWERIHGELLTHREASGCRNLLIPVGAPRKIMAESDAPVYELVAPVSLVKPRRFEDVQALERVVTDILRGYIDKYYRLQQRRWDAKHLDWAQVREAQFAGYAVRVPSGDTELVKSVRKLIKNRFKEFRKAQRVLPNLFFDRHIYQPLLLEPTNELTIHPPGLNEGEEQFVDALKDYCEREQEGELKGKKLFLLRNLSKGKGVGFFEGHGFFPDFILWIKEGKKQRIIFVESHGMVHEDAPARNEKVGLHKRLREDSAAALKRLKNGAVDAFVVSKTPYSKLRNKWVHDNGEPWSKEDCAAEHVLFLEERTEKYDYIKRMLMTE